MALHSTAHLFPFPIESHEPGLIGRAIPPAHVVSLRTVVKAEFRRYPIFNSLRKVEGFLKLLQRLFNLARIQPGLTLIMWKERR